MDALSQIFARHARRLSYQRGDTIIRAGDIPSGLYLIEKGWVKVYNLCDNGEPNIIMSLDSGDIFPLDWAITGILRDVSFTALDETSVLRLSREQFIKGVRGSPQVSEEALKELARCYCRLSNELENLPYRSARERVAFRLLCLAECLDTAHAERIALGLRTSNEYIARSSNMTRETASREISWLARKNIIEHRNNRIIINDMSELKKQAGKNP